MLRCEGYGEFLCAKSSVDLPPELTALAVFSLVVPSSSIWIEH